MSILDKYRDTAKKHSDIQAHLPTLKALAEEVAEQGVYECGFRWGISTWAFLAGGADVVSVDTESCDGDEHKALAKEAGQKFYLRKKDSRDYVPREAPFGLTFLDTVHEYKHLLAELEHVEGFTTRYIVIHDTDRRWEREGKTYSAILDFLKANRDWEMHQHTEACHGLTILVRSSDAPLIAKQ